MDVQLKGFKNLSDTIVECAIPEIADVSASDYEAKKFNFKGEENSSADLAPFIIAHPNEVTLKVQTWLGKTITWTFTPGPYPMPLRKIFNDAGNTETSIQISY